MDGADGEGVASDAEVVGPPNEVAAWPSVSTQYCQPSLGGMSKPLIESLA